MADRMCMPIQNSVFEAQPYTEYCAYELSHHSDLIVCNLSSSGVTLELARELLQHL